VNTGRRTRKAPEVRRLPIFFVDNLLDKFIDNLLDKVEAGFTPLCLGRRAEVGEDCVLPAPAD
jgi:hypothetical protein